MKKKGRPLIVCGIVLLICALGLTVYNAAMSRFAKSETEKIMEQLLPAVKKNHREPSADAEPEYPDYVLDPTMEMPVILIDSREYVGYVEITALSVDLPVCREWSTENLLYAPCLYEGSVYQNNMILCAHNYSSHFGRLKSLSVGDSVVFTDALGNRFDYKVSELELLDAADIEYMSSGNYGLTLFTCTPGGRTRVTVRCEKTSFHS